MEDEFVSDGWSDSVRFDAGTANESFRIMEQNILKQFQTASNRIKPVDNNTTGFSLPDTHSVPHRQSHRGRIRTISSINDESIVDLIKADAPLQVVRKRPSHYRPGEEIPRLHQPQKNDTCSENENAPGNDLPQLAHNDASTSLSSRMKLWFKRSFSFRRAESTSTKTSVVTSIDYSSYLDAEYALTRDDESNHQHAIQCLAAVIVSFVTESDANFHLDMTSPAYGVFLDNPAADGPTRLPSILAVQMFITNIYTFAQLEFDALICALVYIDRLRLATRGALCICHENWQSIVFAALVTASHMWDDFGMINDDLSLIYTNFPTSRINAIERIFVETLDYRLSIRPDQFAKYFYHIHRIMLKASAAPTENDDSAITSLPTSPTASASSFDMSKSSKQCSYGIALQRPGEGLLSRVISYLRSASSSKIYCESSDDVPRSH